MKEFDLIVIGGGAAGLMASIQAASRGLKVLLLEKGPKLGRKILISGGGRCNVTNNYFQSEREFLSNYPRGAKFLWGPFSRFNHQALMHWFESRGLRLKTEADGRVFPADDNSQSVLNVLTREAQTHKVEILLNEQIVSLQKDNNVFSVKNVTEKTYFGKNLLIACGGMSYQHTGSSGDAYQWARNFGHSVVQPKVSLTGFLSPQKWVHELKGLALPDVELSLWKDEKIIAKQKGALLFTHWGITGPGVFKISSLASGTNYASGKFTMQVNSFPALKEAVLREKLKEHLQQNIKRKVVNALEGLLPNRLEKYIISQMQWNTNKNNAEISKIEFNQLMSFLHSLKIEIAGTRPSGEEIVTAGGVELSEIDSKSMQSKIVPGLYWAGEVLDIDGFTGGFNLQAAWSTGWVAGNSVETPSL